MKKVFSLLMTLSLILSACGVIDFHQMDIDQYGSCSQVEVVQVLDLAGNEVAKYVSPPLKSQWSWNESEGEYQRRAVELSTWKTFYDPINAAIANANQQLLHIYSNSGLIYGVSHYEEYIPTEDQILETTSQLNYYSCPLGADPNAPDDYYARSDWSIHQLFSYEYHCDEESRALQYCTETTLGEKITYVKITTPGGSEVNYSYPTAWLDQITYSAFTGSEPLEFNPEFIAPTTELDGQAYGEALLQTLTGNSFREIAQVNLIISDFEGRNELRPVIARAMEVAAVQEGRPVLFTLKGMMSNGQYAVAHISAHQDEIDIGGFMFLGFGTVSGSGGGGDLEMDYSSRFEEVVQGSIYLVP